MKIFVTGATGYVGRHVAQALRRAGHEVWGLARTPEKANDLAKQEIHPVLGSMEKPDSYLEAAGECSVLVHAAMEWGPKGADLDRTTVETLILAGNRGPHPKTLVYTSGVWIYGTTGRAAVDELAPVNPPRLVAWRPSNEQRVLSASSIRGVVVRPGCLYGKEGGLTALWFSGAYRDKSMRIVGDGSNRWTMIHADDLAEGYVRLVESGRHGEVFNLTDRSRFNVGEMARAAAEVSGYTGTIDKIPLGEASKTMGDMAECLVLDQHVDSRKAVRVLGWHPRFGGFCDDAATYFEAWKAFHG